MAEINIDPSVLQERNDTYSSLTDINGANVFTDIYEEKVLEYSESKEKTYQSMQSKVFVEGDGKGNDIYQEVKESMFLGSSTPVVKESENSIGTEYGIVIPVIGIVCVIVAILLFRYVDKRRRSWKEHEIDSYV